MADENKQPQSQETIAIKSNASVFYKGKEYKLAKDGTVTIPLEAFEHMQTYHHYEGRRKDATRLKFESAGQPAKAAA